MESLWLSIKYEEVYLHAYESIPQAREGVGKYLLFYNAERRHQTLGITPDQAYDGETTLPLAA